MISKIDAEKILNGKYSRDGFIRIVENLLPDYTADSCVPADFNKELFASVEQLGKSESCDIYVYEVKLKNGVSNRRVAITREMFRVLRGLLKSNALISFVNADIKNYRISLLTSKYEIKNGVPQKVLSNPRRYSFSLGVGVKTKTAYDFLIAQGKATSHNKLKERFSVEVVNEIFYREIAKLFTQLVGGKTYDDLKFDSVLKINGNDDKNKDVEFAVRLIGRIVFCWFLKEKKSAENTPLIPDNIFTDECIDSHTNYYHTVLEPLFYEVLNTPIRDRKTWVNSCNLFDKIPYLNGGLFSPHQDDHYLPIENNANNRDGDVFIPDEWFKDFFKILNQYNFTVDENTAYDVELSIDPEMLGRIFENLLAEINPETGKSARNSTGSFYTPRDIVDYMVDTSLSGYLQKQTGIDENTIDNIISYNRNDDLYLSDDDKSKIIDALYNVTVLDPACGSGAFPIGMLQKIVYILQYVDPKAKVWFKKATEGVPDIIINEMKKHLDAEDYDYIRKLTVIQRSIFGVDIQPIAVEIARLRCFLSIIIEETVSDEEGNRGIKALPNLEFKFVVANSLSRLPDESGTGIQMDIFTNVDLEKKIGDIREEFFATSDARQKNTLRDNFADIQESIRVICNKNKGSEAVTRFTQILNWHPFSYDSTEWFDPLLMFGVGNGFDIVMGNPPYIALQKLKGKLSEMYKAQKYLSHTGRGDVYCLFYERGCQLLKNGGILAYITSNKWMRDAYGLNLRDKVLSQYNSFLLIDFPGQKIFKGATVENNILFVSRELNRGYTLACNATNEDRDNLTRYVRQNCQKYSFEPMHGWFIDSSKERAIKNKIKAYGKPLCQKLYWDFKINFGVKTGCNAAFIISEEKRSELIAEDSSSAEIIRPILRGRDIKRYSIDFAQKYIILARFGSYVDMEEKYPAVYKHLLCKKTDLEKRGQCRYTSNGMANTNQPYPGQHHWLELDNNPSNEFLDDFSKPKIVWKRIGSMLRFYYDEDGYIGLDSTCFATGEHIKYLAAVLNTNIGTYLFKDSPKTGTGDLIISVQAFEPICVPCPTPEVEYEIVELFNKIRKSEDEKERERLENELEYKVSKMYHFDDDELEYIINTAQKYRYTFPE